MAPGRYEIIAGERRTRGEAGRVATRCRCSLKNVPDEAAAAMALIENIQREGPTRWKRQPKRLTDEFGLTHEQAAGQGPSAQRGEQPAAPC